MNKQRFFLFFTVILFSGNMAFAQSIAGVNPLTGAAGVAIPVYSFSRGLVNFPITLVYGGNGVKVKDVEGSAGMGWNVVAGGQVSRLVRGLPDDCTQDNAANSRLGWMSSSNKADSLLSHFSIANNGSTCSNETSDISYINTNFPITLDTEPDIFYVNAPGLSCQLVYDKSLPGFRPITYQDVKISYTTSSGKITSFTITNDKGVQYVFSGTELATQTAVGSSPSYFKTAYQQYQHGISYYDAWYLTSVTDANGNGILLDYTTGSTRNSKDSVALYIGGSATRSLQYYIQESVTPKTLSTVLSTDGDLITTQLTFTWTSNSISGGTGASYISSVTGMGKDLQFKYSPVKYVTSLGTNYYRQFLREFIDGSAGSPIDYTFAYYGETAHPPLSDSAYTTVLPDSSSFKQDYWGYYSSNSYTSLLPKVWVNPSNSSYQRYQVYLSSTGGSNYTYSLSGNIMTVDTANIDAGSLKTITYAQGGRTTITYESNDFHDPQANVTDLGGGIRVKQITDEGYWGTSTMIRNYSYLNPSTGVTSGKPITLPVFAFTIPYGGAATGLTLWTDATALSTSDLSDEEHTIVYGYCRESKTGGGSTLYQHYLPATNWDNSAVPGCSGCSTSDWSPATDLVGRNNCSLSYGPITNAIYSYPFIPNTNYDFERGLLQKVTNYLDNGTTEASETDYTYQRSYTPSAITAFRWDVNSNGSLATTAYNKYSIYYNTSELIATVTRKAFDSQTYSQSQSSKITYSYGSAYHKMPTRKTVTNSDGSILTTKISYTKDYPSAGAGTNPNVTAIYQLDQLNENLPVEVYQQVTRLGVKKIIDGSLTLFSNFSDGGGTQYMPSQQLNLVQSAGLDSASFTPYNASGSGGSQVSTYNSNYFPVANYIAYDYSGYPQTGDDNNHHEATTAVDHVTYKPELVVKNAAYDEVAFNDFNSTTYIPLFYITGSGSFTPTGSHAGASYGFGNAQTATATVSKNAVAQNYIFSMWINASSGTDTLHISLNNGSYTAYTYTGTGTWKYYEWKLSVSGMPSSFPIKFTSSQNIGIDDILFYPETAEVTTFSYDPTTYFKIAQTDTNGVSTYYTNDQWGRVLYVYDQDHNIIQRNSYVIPTSF